jgi:peptide/nickel transport system substrate-binding protein
LIEAFRNEFDDSKRIEIIKKWQQLIYDEQPYTFLWSGNSRYVYDKRFKNTRWYAKSPSPQYNEWWVPKDNQKYTQTMR